MTKNTASIRTYLLLLVLAVSVPLLAIVGWGIYRDFQQSVDQTKTSLRALTITMVSNTDGKIAYAHEILERLAKRRVSTAPLDKEHCDLGLADMHSMLPGFTNIGYTNPDGDIVCSALAMSQTLNVGKADWFQALQKSQRFTVGPPFIGVISKKWVLVLTQPLWNARKEVVGGINVSLDLNSYDPQIPIQHIPPGSIYGFLGEDATLIWRNVDPQGLMGKRLNSEATQRALQVRDGEFEAKGADGVQYVLSVVPMPKAEWFAFVGVPKKPVYEQALHRALTATALALAAIGAMVLMAISFARRIAAPVTLLEDVVRQVQQGDRGVRAHPQGPREVAAVAQEFNAMLDARLLSEQHLAQSEARYRSLIEHAPEAIVVLDLALHEPQVVDANPSAVTLFGCSYAQLVGAPLSRLFAVQPTEDPDTTQSGDEILVRVTAGEVVQTERNVHALDGRTLICEIHLAKLQGAEHQLLRVTFVDISQRKRDEAVIIALNRRLQAVFDSASEVAIVATDAHGYIQVFNRGAERMLGYSAEDVKGQLPTMFHREAELLARALELNAVFGQTLSPLEALFAQARGGEPDVRNWTFVCKDGHLLSVSMALTSVRDQSGQVIGFLGVARDISEQLAAEAGLQKLNVQLDQRVRERTQELQKALDELHRTQDKLVQSEKLAALGSIVAAMAHEMNTPIGNCLMVASTQDDNARAFERAISGGSTFKRSQLMDYLAASRTANELLEKGLRRAADLVDNFKQIAVNQRVSQRRHFRLQDSVSDTVVLMQANLPMAAYEMETRIADELTLDSYPAAIEQIIANLISNAVLHGFDGRGHGVMHLSARIEGDMVRIVFSDDGRGMSEDVRLHVFDPFFTTRLGQGGNGLGMSICYNLVTGPLGGSVEVSSALGEGSCFIFTLPLVAP